MTVCLKRKAPRHHVLCLSNAYHVIRLVECPAGWKWLMEFRAVKAFPFNPPDVSASSALLSARLHAAELEASL